MSGVRVYGAHEGALKARDERATIEETWLDKPHGPRIAVGPADDAGQPTDRLWSDGYHTSNDHGRARMRLAAAAPQMARLLRDLCVEGCPACDGWRMVSWRKHEYGCRLATAMIAAGVLLPGDMWHEPLKGGQLFTYTESPK